MLKKLSKCVSKLCKSIQDLPVELASKYLWNKGMLIIVPKDNPTSWAERYLKNQGWIVIDAPEITKAWSDTVKVCMDAITESANAWAELVKGINLDAK